MAYNRPPSNACRCVQDTLFADMAIYEYMAHEQLAITAWYVAKEFSDAFDVGMDAASKLAARFPDDKDKAENLAWFQKLREGATSSHEVVLRRLMLLGSSETRTLPQSGLKTMQC